MNLRESYKLIKELSKSGIVTLVLISVFAGYLIGHSAEVPLSTMRLFLTLLGVLFLASGSSALNQLQEVDRDALMPRTANRPLPSGRMSPLFVKGFITFTLTLGLALLTHLSLTLLFLGVLAVISYNGLYTLWWKRHWAHAAIPGAIPGAIPILMGHVAADDNLFHPSGIYLFALLFFWQMPHFWTLALRYKDDYAQGGFPTLPVKLGQSVTLRQINVWCLAYLGIAAIAPLFLGVRWIYVLPTLLISFKVVQELYKFAKDPNGKQWLHFFLWINLSLVVYLAAAVLDLWQPFFCELWLKHG